MEEIRLRVKHKGRAEGEAQSFLARDAEFSNPNVEKVKCKGHT